jgi:hypothetical protein
MFSFLSNFKHKQEMRESKDEILIGEIVRVMNRLSCQAVGFQANNDFQSVRFRPGNQELFHSIIIQLDRKTGGGMLQAAILGSQATLLIQAEVKNYLADPDDLIAMYKTDIANIFKFPMLGDVKVNHQLNSIFGTKKILINIDNYILKGEETVNALTNLIVGIIEELEAKLKQFKKA